MSDMAQKMDDQIEGGICENEQLRTQLAKVKKQNSQMKADLESEFNPDWDLVLASQESLREHMIELAEVTAERDRLRDLCRQAYALIDEEWDNLTDEEGYGPCNLHRRLKESAPDE